jgi:acyl-CoA thioester hydrolase
VKIRVYYEDTDAGGIVYHSNYLNFCERARSEMFFSKQMLPIIDGGHFVVRHIDANFLKPAKFADELHVISELVELKNTSLKMAQHIYRGEEKLFSMTSTLVYVKNERVGRLDAQKKELLTSLLT